MIDVRNVSKSFRGEAVLKDVSLRCEGGRIYGIVGYNGSGKTCCSNVSAGFSMWTQGKYS